MSNLIKVYGENYEVICKDCETHCGAHMIINDMGAKKMPSYCAYCGSKEISITKLRKRR